MTNGEAYNILTDKERADCFKVYDNHPLTDYIDWDSYYESENGNALDFVNCLDRFVDEDNGTVFVLEEFVEDDMDYCLVYVCALNAFFVVPAFEEMLI